MCKHSPSHKHNHRRLPSYLLACLAVFVSQPARLNNNTTWHQSLCPAPIISTASQDDLLQIFFPPTFSLQATQTELSLPRWIIISIIGVMWSILKNVKKKSQLNVCLYWQCCKRQTHCGAGKDCCNASMAIWDFHLLDLT